MRYVEARYKEHQREEAYRIYISDSLYYKGRNQMLTARYAELIEPKRVDNRSAEEIVLSVMKHANLKFKG